MLKNHSTSNAPLQTLEGLQEELFVQFVYLIIYLFIQIKVIVIRVFEVIKSDCDVTSKETK